MKRGLSHIWHLGPGINYSKKIGNQFIKMSITSFVPVGWRNLEQTWEFYH